MISTRLMSTIICSSMVCGLLSGCAIFNKKDTDQESNWIVKQFEKTGDKSAEMATVAYSQGDFKKAQELVLESLRDNPRNQQALLVGALNAEKLGRANRARQYYEDLIIINGDQKTILGTDSGVPEKISEIARRRLRMLTIKQSELVIENPNGIKTFKISDKAGAEQTKATINRALEKRTAPQPVKKPDIGELFTANEQNIISRFLILKELAEKDLITKDEFLSRRTANVGGLLPLTSTPPATGIDAPVPSPDLIIERINVLKDAVESRAITPREFSAERDVIIEALLPPNPRTRMKPKAPSKDILGAAKDLRKLEVIYDLNLITSKEKDAEKKAIERYLGINRAAPKTQTDTQAQQVAAPVQPTTASAPTATAVVNADNSAPEVQITVKEPEPETINATAEVATPAAVTAPQNIVPNVSSPF